MARRLKILDASAILDNWQVHDEVKLGILESITEQERGYQGIDAHLSSKGGHESAGQVQVHNLWSWLMKQAIVFWDYVLDFGNDCMPSGAWN